MEKIVESHSSENSNEAPFKIEKNSYRKHFENQSENNRVKFPKTTHAWCREATRNLVIQIKASENKTNPS